MNFRFIILFFFFSLIGFSQNSVKNNTSFQEKINRLKTQDNLEEYYYTYFDYFINNAKTESISLLKQAEVNQWRKPSNNKEKIALLHLKINLAYHYLKVGDIENAIIHYENAFYYFKQKQIKNYDIISYCLKPLANNYTRIGDFERAEELFKHTIGLAIKTNNKNALITTYLNYSIVLQSQNKNHKAITLLEKALRINGISTMQVNEIKSAIAKNNYLLNQYKKALYQLNNLENNYQNNTTKALCYVKLNKFEKAEKLLIHLLKSKKKSARKMAKSYNLLAQINLKTNKYQQALSNYQKTLKLLIPNFNTEKLPLNQLFAENTLLDALDGKAKIYTKLGDFEKAIHNYQLAFKVEELLQQIQTSQQAKIIQQQENKIRRENIIAIYYQLFQKSNDTTYIHKALKNVASSKSKVLLEKLHQNNFKNKINKDSLFIKENKLRKEKGILSKKIKLEELKNEQANIDLLKTLIYKKSVLTTKLEVLKQTILKKYPFINNTKNNSNISAISTYLTKNQQIISFFDTKEILYIFSITKSNSNTWRRIVKDTKYQNNLQNYINLFVNDNGNKLKDNFQTYQKTAFYLYQKLVAPELENSDKNTLTIIPDGKLNFVTFDALLTKKTAYRSFEKLPYLIYKKQINYNYSLQILANQQAEKTTKKATKSVLGVFPYFENNYRDLQELTYTKNEKNALTHYQKSLLLEKDNASKKQFLKNANKYDILHLSTHASAGDFEEPAHIEFRNETLYLPEIYGLNLQSNLLVLSACETGIGKLQKGEGSMSLSRAFLYAGIKNLMVSQWKVNDKSTSILMQNFYTNYKKAIPISNALYQAKIDYLHNKKIADLKKTPYYWSGFVFIGNVESFPSSNYLWIGLFLLIFLIIIYSIVRKK